MVDRPDYAGRSEILKVHARGKTLAKDVDLDKIARRTPGYLQSSGIVGTVYHNLTVKATRTQ